MIGIVIPLKSRAMSADWRLTQQLLRQTLHSVLRQTNQDFMIVVVHHDRPDLGSIGSSRVELVDASFPPPVQKEAGPMRRDKEQKVLAGVRLLLERGCEWVLKLDADDLLAKETCAFIATCDADAVIFNSGIIASRGSNWHIMESESFHRVCGSCMAFHRRMLTESPGQQHLPPMFDLLVTDGHSHPEEECRQLSARISYPPFPAACYVQSADIRLSALYNANYKPTLREFVGRLRRLRWTTREVRERFGLVASL